MIEPEKASLRKGFETLKLQKTLVLVGLMGAGKTSVGKRVAAILNVNFVDSDSEIVEAAGMSIPEIFADLGEAAFRDGERRVIARLLAGPPCILATGGGAFMEARTREEIEAHGTSVWIRADVQLLWERVRGRPGRPLLDNPNPRKVLEDLQHRRAPTYARADVIVDSVRGASHVDMAVKIIEAVRVHDRDVTSQNRTIGERC